MEEPQQQPQKRTGTVLGLCQYPTASTAGTTRSAPKPSAMEIDFTTRFAQVPDSAPDLGCNPQSHQTAVPGRPNES